MNDPLSPSLHISNLSGFDGLAKKITRVDTKHMAAIMVKVIW
jgi:hypothetical protein